MQWESEKEAELFGLRNEVSEALEPAGVREGLTEKGRIVNALYWYPV